MAWVLNVWYAAATGAVVADMSAAGKSVTEWFKPGPVGEFVSMTPVWPANGTPVGALTLEKTNEANPVVATVGDEVDLSDNYTTENTEPNPAGTAGRKPVLVQISGGSFRWAYTRTSGGAGAACVVHCAR